MPRKNPPDPILIPLRGTPAYREFLAGLRAAEGADSLSDLAERAIRLLARRHKLVPPARCRPVGWNQHAGGAPTP